MSGTNLAHWYDAIVPGSVYRDLLDNQVINNPYYRYNEYEIKALMEHDYFYRREFILPKTFFKKHNYLICHGLDTLATIILNGEVIAHTNNMHRTYRFEVTPYLKEGKNLIEFCFASPLRYVDEKVKQCPLHEGAIRRFSHLRKAHYMFGWDWGPELPDAGIWQDIFLESTDVGYIDDVHVAQQHKDNKVILNITCKNVLITNDAIVQLIIISPQGIVIGKYVDKALDQNMFIVEINNPELWWPVGYGEQPLYKLEVSLRNEKEENDKRELRIGLRSIKLHREKDCYGESFTFIVNGTPIFLKGANYIPEDIILSRTNKERTKKLLESAIIANHNCIRVWGGGYYPRDYFYDLCDEMGILVWQDLMFACSVYNVEDPSLLETIIPEIHDNLKRIKHHPSLLIICGNNEIEQMVVNWNIPDKEIAQQYYLFLFEDLLPKVVKEVYPDCLYWPSSPSSGGKLHDPNSDKYGDMHYWGVWHENKPITSFREYYPALISEFGIQSFPSLETIESFTLPEDRNIFSYVMECHQKDVGANAKIVNYIGKMFKFPNDFDSLVYLSQLIQAEGCRYAVEHLRRHYGRCMGAIYWQLNDCWPVASWSSIDYYHRWKALHYHSKKFFAKVLLSLEETDGDVTIYITNETNKPIKGNVIWKLIDFYGKRFFENVIDVEVPSYSSKKIDEIIFKLDLDKKMNTVFYAQLIVNDELISENSVSFAPDKHLHLPKATINYELENEGMHYTLTLRSDVFCKFVEVTVRQEDIIFSDNYFHLLPNIPRTITFACSKDKKEIIKNLQIRSLIDSF